MSVRNILALNYCLLALLCGVATLSSGTQSHAGVLAFDNFDYADGTSLTTTPKWSNHSGTAGDLKVNGGKAVVQHGVPSEDANIAVAITSGDVYYALDFSVDDLGAPYSGLDNEYFAHFKEGFNFSARLDVVEAPGGRGFSVGIASDESTADFIWPVDLSFGTVYRAIVRYNQDDNIAQLWINASVPGDPSILGEDRADPGDTIDSFALRQSDSGENETVRVDNLVVGMTFGDVVTAVPEPASLVLMLVGLAGLATRRRRRVPLYAVNPLSVEEHRVSRCLRNREYRPNSH